MKVDEESESNNFFQSDSSEVPVGGKSSWGPRSKEGGTGMGD